MEKWTEVEKETFFKSLEDKPLKHLETKGDDHWFFGTRDVYSLYTCVGGDATHMVTNHKEQVDIEVITRVKRYFIKEKVEYNYAWK